MNDVEIFEQVLLEKDGKVISKFAVIVGGGLSTDNPTEEINNAVVKYTNGVPHNQFVNIKLNNPWTRVVISGINQLKFFDYNEKGLKQMERWHKLNQLTKSLKSSKYDY